MTYDEIIFDPATGTVGAIYSDDVMPLLRDVTADLTTRRASDVEPDEAGGWTATMRPWVPGGTVALGSFPTRTQALEAEVEYLRRVLCS